MTAVQPKPEYSETFERTPAAVGISRDLVRHAASAWELDGYVTESAVLVVSEPVTNAVKHTRSRHLLVIVEIPVDDRLRLVVVDFAPDLIPVLRTVCSDSPDGRGLALVDALADRWGYDLLGPSGHPSRKRTWAELAVSAKPGDQ
ncbi:ATP-binding protein [Streptomyces sp. NRRL B-1347]|uniref:ATP-binding protein n=1 Tax=Streptomyces sp. NRRL B-1347 TaxID=1476877 RepID=UPI00056450FC|nr:ATP-binding protein [Streptomyces sp. NRRL B-1347]